MPEEAISLSKNWVSSRHYIQLTQVDITVFRRILELSVPGSRTTVVRLWHQDVGVRDWKLCAALVWYQTLAQCSIAVMWRVSGLACGEKKTFLHLPLISASVELLRCSHTCTQHHFCDESRVKLQHIIVKNVSIYRPILFCSTARLFKNSSVPSKIYLRSWRDRNGDVDLTFHTHYSIDNRV